MVPRDDAPAIGEYVELDDEHAARVTFRAPYSVFEGVAYDSVEFSPCPGRAMREDERRAAADLKALSTGRGGLDFPIARVALDVFRDGVTRDVELPYPATVFTVVREDSDAHTSLSAEAYAIDFVGTSPAVFVFGRPPVCRHVVCSYDGRVMAKCMVRSSGDRMFPIYASLSTFVDGMRYLHPSSDPAPRHSASLGAYSAPFSSHIRTAATEAILDALTSIHYSNNSTVSLDDVTRTLDNLNELRGFPVEVNASWLPAWAVPLADVVWRAENV